MLSSDCHEVETPNSQQSSAICTREGIAFSPQDGSMSGDAKCQNSKSIDINWVNRVIDHSGRIPGHTYWCEAWFWRLLSEP